MILTDPLQHRAAYDNDGNIILPPEDENETPVTIHLTPRDGTPIAERVAVLRSLAHEALAESAQQYMASIEEGSALLEESKLETETVLKRAWQFLRQPIRLPIRAGGNKEYSRIVLFVVDTVRFGGTFAAIFLALFVTINYESFLQISQARVQAFLESPSIDGNSMESTPLEERLEKGAASLASAPEGSLVRFLPEVGPPQNMLIIPKLNLSVPLISPPVESLLREDWKQVEQDIQSGLTNGVVHYPGTARPGQAGNFFVTGHSSYYPWAEGEYKTVFARLHELQPGDEYWVYYGGDKHRYVIEGKKEIRPTDISVLDQPVDRRASTLMTCTPVGTTLRRLILTAQEVDPESAASLHVGEKIDRKEQKIRVEALSI